jgi:hypothetical protein
MKLVENNQYRHKYTIISTCQYVSFFNDFGKIKNISFTFAQKLNMITT